MISEFWKRKVKDGRELKQTLERPNPVVNMSKSREKDDEMTGELIPSELVQRDQLRNLHDPPEKDLNS